MSSVDKIVELVGSSELSEEQKRLVLDEVETIKTELELKTFQTSRLKDNLKINTRFLNKTVEDLEKTVGLLKDSNQQLSNFVKIASHDLKSPLRSISSFSALLNKMLVGKLNEKEVDYFQIIETSAKSMSALIDDLLLFTRINAEDLNVKDEGLTQMLQEVLHNLDHDIKNNEVLIENNFKEISLNCDPIKFKQVLQNLIGNGIKFSSYDGNKPQIILNLEEDSNMWVFSIQDNGIGIDKEFRDDIFSEFKRLNGNEFEGTGMGLSIVKKIINKHQGNIWVADSHKKGTTVVFTLPKQLVLEAN